MVIKYQNLGLIILAGGKSSRMGKDKAFLELGEGTLIEMLVEKGRAFGFDEIIIVSNEIEKYLFLKVKVVKDFYPGMGPLAGIHAGLTHSRYWNNFVIPCDMPFISLELIKQLLAVQNDCKVVVPKIGDKFQPLAALYTKDCVSHIAYLLENKISKVIELYDLVKTCYLEIEENNCFFNINTPDDFLKAKKYVKEDVGYGKSEG